MLEVVQLRGRGRVQRVDQGGERAGIIVVEETPLLEDEKELFFRAALQKRSA